MLKKKADALKARFRDIAKKIFAAKVSCWVCAVPVLPPRSFTHETACRGSRPNIARVELSYHDDHRLEQ